MSKQLGVAYPLLTLSLEGRFCPFAGCPDSGVGNLGLESDFSFPSVPPNFLARIFLVVVRTKITKSTAVRNPSLRPVVFPYPFLIRYSQTQRSQISANAPAVEADVGD